MNNYTEINLDKRRKLFNFNKNSLSVVILIFFHFLMNIWWIFHNNVPLNWDPSIHIMNTYKFTNSIPTFLLNFNIIEFLKISNYYPIFIYILNIPLLFISNGNYKILLLSGTLFFSMTIMFLYLYSSKLFNNKNIGFLTVFFFSFFITIYQSSREYMLDIPLTALIMSCLYFLEKGRQKNKAKYIYMFFLIFAFAQLTKWYAFIYLLIPTLFFTVNNFRQIKSTYINHIAKAIIIFITIVLPWYMVNFDTILGKSSRAWIGEIVDKVNSFSWEQILLHLKLIILFQTNFFGFLFLIVSVYFIIKNKSHRKFELLAMVLFLYLFFSFIPNKNIRYLIPLMPFIAMIMAYGVHYLIETKKILFIFLSSFLIFYYIFSFFVLSFGIPIFPRYKFSLRLPLINWIDLYYLADYPVKIIYDENMWPQQQIVNDIKNITNKNTALFLCAVRYLLNADNFNLIMMMNHVDNIQLSSYYQLQEMKEFLKDFEFILIPKNHVIGEEKNYVSYKPLSKFQQYFLSGNATNYSLIKTYFLPSSQSLIDDSDILYLYKKQAP